MNANNNNDNNNEDDILRAVSQETSSKESSPNSRGSRTSTSGTDTDTAAMNTDNAYKKRKRENPSVVQDDMDGTKGQRKEDGKQPKEQHDGKQHDGKQPKGKQPKEQHDDDDETESEDDPFAEEPHARATKKGGATASNKGGATASNRGETTAKGTRPAPNKGRPPASATNGRGPTTGQGEKAARPGQGEKAARPAGSTTGKGATGATGTTTGNKAAGTTTGDEAAGNKAAGTTTAGRRPGKDITWAATALETAIYQAFEGAPPKHVHYYRDLSPIKDELDEEDIRELVSLIIDNEEDAATVQHYLLDYFAEKGPYGRRTNGESFAALYKWCIEVSLVDCCDELLTHAMLAQGGAKPGFHVQTEYRNKMVAYGLAHYGIGGQRNNSQYFRFIDKSRISRCATGEPLPSSPEQKAYIFFVLFGCYMAWCYCIPRDEISPRKVLETDAGVWRQGQIGSNKDSRMSQNGLWSERRLMSLLRRDLLEKRHAMGIFYPYARMLRQLVTFRPRNRGHNPGTISKSEWENFNRIDYQGKKFTIESDPHYRMNWKIYRKIYRMN